MRSEILSAVHSVSERLNGRDYKEVSFQNLMLYYLQKNGFNCSSEVNVSYDIDCDGVKVCVGWGRIDIIARGRENLTYIIELKCVPSHKYLETYRQQLSRYLFHYGRPCVGCLIIFDGTGGHHVEFK